MDRVGFIHWFGWIKTIKIYPTLRRHPHLVDIKQAEPPGGRHIILYGEDEVVEEEVTNWSQFLQLGSSLGEEELRERLEGQVSCDWSAAGHNTRL